MSAISPCQDCKKRTVDCHGTCEAYRKYKNRHNAESAYAYRNKMRIKVADNVHFENVRKTMKKVHR